TDASFLNDITHLLPQTAAQPHKPKPHPVARFIACSVFLLHFMHFFIILSSEKCLLVVNL
ncbi:MAG: hypothetical protein FWD36_08050, partial [Treponema sp.]|nr:hypothetical protein [Treponema sp.]